MLDFHYGNTGAAGDVASLSTGGQERFPRLACNNADAIANRDPLPVLWLINSVYMRFYWFSQAFL